MSKRFLVNMVLLSFVFILFGCGGYDSPPEDGSITVSPSSIKITDPSGPVEIDRGQFLVVVKDADGIPLNNVEVVVSYPWAVPSPAGAVQFYDGSTPVNSPMTVITDKNGAYIVKFSYQRGGIEYKGDFQFIAGSLSTTATFEVETGS
ncbi:MAG: hypothetical protein GXP46_00130 [Deferribacteres bacterium]|nr:hypothetical protein [Deferribacteres bacterium]